MEILPQEVIRKKRDGGVLSDLEIKSFLDGYVAGEIPDYQMSALLMAVFYQGFNQAELKSWLNANIYSGKVLKWDGLRAHGDLIVDKHSSGGVGDKTSFIVLPLLIADGFKVPMVAGRGLGHTGGTLDKLESLPGFNCQMSVEAFQSQVSLLGGAFGAQTDEFVPADKKLYRLRDVTATVDCIPLIVASIMGKKLAEGLDALVMDVKVGSGAFMTDLESGRNLAQGLINAGKAAGCRTRCLLTNMNQPLGRAAGNAAELVEVISILRGSGPSDTKELSVLLAAHLACAARGLKGQDALEGAISRMNLAIDSGQAFKILSKILIAQGAHAGDVDLSNPEWVFGSTKTLEVYPKRSGVVATIDARALGISLIHLGGGRLRSSDPIDHQVALENLKKIGESVDPEKQPLCTVRFNATDKLDAVVELIQRAYQTVDAGVSVPQESLIYEVIG